MTNNMYYPISAFALTGRTPYMPTYTQGVALGYEQPCPVRAHPLTLMIAESKTEEKDVMVKVVVNLINQRNE